ncbi:MAG: hypothetical protein QOI20_1581 [Acidimicrobiaceae bacterium]|jgi:GAF domain-containing protein|nr:hypothetical protein [Acidimicrobiaceae bacterium]
MSDSPLGGALAALSRFFVGEATLEDTLLRVSELAVQSVPGADVVGLTLMVEQRPKTAAFTDEMAAIVDQAQYDADDGPCLQAYREQAVFTIESTRADGPWPEFRQAAADHGIGSTLSLPLVVDAQGVGAMNLYSRRERGFDQSSQDTASQFAAQAAIVLANSQAYWDARGLSERLGQAMKSRAVIEQAKGVLMAAQHCDAEEAFELLVRASQRENVKLRDIASRIVKAATAPDPT